MKALANVNKITGDLDFGVKNKEMMAASMAASGSDGDSIGGLFATFQKFKTKSDQENLLAMDFLNQLGKEGGFELKDFAQSGTKIFSAYAGTGRTGPEAFKEMGAVMESAMDAVGDRDLAATASFNLLNDLRNPKIAKILEASGVKLRDKSGGMLAINEIVKNIAQLSGKDGPKRQDERLAKAGLTDYSRLIISSVTTGKGAENFARYNAVVADGSGIMADAKYAAQDFTSAMTSLNVTWKKFANSNLARPVQELADAINSVDQKTVQNWLETGKQIAFAVAGVIAARKAFQIGKGALDLFGVGKGKGIPKGVSDVFGSGVMPVYVVNMGSGGMGGGPDIGGPVAESLQAGVVQVALIPQWVQPGWLDRWLQLSHFLMRNQTLLTIKKTAWSNGLRTGPKNRLSGLALWTFSSHLLAIRTRHRGRLCSHKTSLAIRSCSNQS